ncbi:MAG: hypothetical protein ACI9DH_000543 [Halioglobus sp.]|jgi:hypothetical protein
MHCPDYNIFRTRLICLTMYSNMDAPKKYVPKTQWINPFRYEIILLPKGYSQNARTVIINPHGMAWIKVSNFIYRVKRKTRLIRSNP